MTTNLLAFESIAPMLGSVVLSGAFSFLGGIILARKAFENRQAGPLQEPAADPIDEPPHTEQLAKMNLNARQISELWQEFLALQQQARELRSTRHMLELRAISDSQSDEPVETLDRFANRLCEMTSSDRVGIYFVARRLGERLQPIVQCGVELPRHAQIEWGQHEQTLARIAIESDTGSLQDTDLLQQLPETSPIRSSINLPIRVNGRVLGALCLTCQDQSQTLEDNRKLIEFAAEILSQTLRRVFEEATIRRQARHDHLTDLVNRRSLDGYLQAEISRVRHGESAGCSLILADLDLFKHFNDRFGHQTGDHVLRETARVLKDEVSKLRAGEHCVVARYGGEEFAILLPNVGLAGACRIAEGIRAAVESEKIRVKERMLNVTLSLGAAVCPQQADSVETLIAAADRALYQAKSNGRNCVCHVNDDQSEAPAVWQDRPLGNHDDPVLNYHA